MSAAELATPIDAEVVDLLDETAAKKLDMRIRSTAATVRDNFAKLQDYVHEAKAGEIHCALGFKSWTAYLSDALGAQPLMVDREQRRELVEFEQRSNKIMQLLQDKGIRLTQDLFEG